MTNNRFFILLLLLSTAGLGTPVLAQVQPANNSSCGTLFSSGQYGPYDFRTDKDKLPIVLGAHFTPEVEALIRGKSSGTPGGDIAYTLSAIPNYPNALIAMMRLAEKEKTPQPRGSRYSVECWFERALRFRPDDNVARMIYATFLAKNGRTPQVLEQLERVTATAGDNAFTHYNAGLIYADIKDYDKALAQAHRALALGLPRPELRDRLQAAGKWQEQVAKPLPATTAPDEATGAATGRSTPPTAPASR